ncbi:MAG: CinA family nicotinamide mononucleotide deamidase-related protein, partial [Thermodesulfobacteriota bacterium]|nr:CinA family nicotinamide mononucleotide deamidase-related protein [Thermodesulfobacteriota bacterium]
LVLGQLVDTNAAYIAQALAEIGIGLAYHTTVGDDRARQAEVFRTALDRCRIVISTGGIGPTEDDLTRDVAAQVIGRELVFHPELLEFIEGLFRRIGYSMPENNRRQAYIPDGAEVIHNPHGTAPAFRYEYDGRVLVCLPGVPRETEFLLKKSVLPFLQERYTPAGQVLLNRVLKVCGLGESSVDTQLRDLIQASANPVIGLQASQTEIKVRLTAMAGSRGAAQVLLDRGEAEIRERLGPLIFGLDDETLPGNAAGLLEERGLSLAVAEALTGGQVTAEISRHLKLGRLKGGLILGRPAGVEELCSEAKLEFAPDVVLGVAGNPDDEGRMQVEILVQGKDGREREQTLSLGGPRHMVQQRAKTMALFTLLRFLREHD